MLKIEEVKENYFYKLKYRQYYGYRSPAFSDLVIVARCTQIQDFSDRHAGYIVYHFKSPVREIVVTNQEDNWSRSYKNSIDILEEITDDKLKDTTIEFIDDTHYKKLVNRNTYKIYEMPTKEDSNA